jgi:hypothetical protein
MAFLEKIPSWLRWILFLPLALISFYYVWFYVSCVVDTLVQLIIPTGKNLFWQILPCALALGLSTFVFVWVGAKVAPRAKFRISIGLAVLFCLTFFLLFMGRYFDPEGLFSGAEAELGGFFSWTGLIVGFGAGLVGAFAACYLFYRKAKPQDAEYEVIEINDQEE